MPLTASASSAVLSVSEVTESKGLVGLTLCMDFSASLAQRLISLTQGNVHVLVYREPGREGYAGIIHNVEDARVSDYRQISMDGKENTEMDQQAPNIPYLKVPFLTVLNGDVGQRIASMPASFHLSRYLFCRSVLSRCSCHISYVPISRAAA